MTLPVIALLGRKDQPTDAVEEYCRYLGEALQAHGIQLEVRRVPWEIHGWRASFDVLLLMAAKWNGQWVIVQYTALAWSARGFPQRFLRVLNILKQAGARVAIVYHDAEPFAGTRLIDRIRRNAQLRTMRRALSQADIAVFPVPVEKITWLSTIPSNCVYIPVGPNLPIPVASSDLQGQVTLKGETPCVSVFSITGGENGARETQNIVAILRQASEQLGKVRLSVFGRHAEVRESALRGGLRDCTVELSVEGVVDPEQVVQRLSASDVLLFLRGPISSRRGSAIAGIACGLPVIASAGSETAAPITEAGVVIAPPNEPDEFAKALIRVLSDPAYLADLAARSKSVFARYLSWPVIAAQFAEFLTKR